MSTGAQNGFVKALKEMCRDYVPLITLLSYYSELEDIGDDEFRRLLQDVQDSEGMFMAAPLLAILDLTEELVDGEIAQLELGVRNNGFAIAVRCQNENLADEAEEYLNQQLKEHISNFFVVAPEKPLH